MPTISKRGPVTQSAKQRRIASETMKAMRAKNPDKFDPKKNGAAEGRKRAKLKPKPQPAPAGTVAPAPVPDPAPPVAPPAPQPVPEPKPAPIAQPALPRIDPIKSAEPVKQPVFKVESADIFNPVPEPAPAPSAGPGASISPDPNAGPGASGSQPNAAGQGSGPQEGAPADPQPEAKPSPGANRALAMMVWGMILQMCVLLFGPEMLPKKFTTPAGEIDENENVIAAWCDYFDSLGFVRMTPLWNLILVMSGYFLLRLNLILQWFKDRRLKSAKTPGTKATSPEEKPPEAQPQPGSTARPAPGQPQPPRPTPEEKSTEVELEVVAEGSFT
jgi:hypothetical protein